MLDEARSELLRLEKTHGMLTAGIVLDAAEDENSPLHEYMTWSDNVAAHDRRLHQARMLIKRVRVTYKDKKVSQFYRVNVQVSEDDEVGYVSLGKVLKNNDLRMQVRMNAIRDLEFFKQKYANEEEILSVIDEEALDSVKKEVK